MLEDGRHVRRWERQKSHHHRHPHHEQSLMRYQRRRGLRTKCGARGQSVEPLRGVGPLRPRPDHVGCPRVALGLKIEDFIVPLDPSKSHHLDGHEARCYQ